MANAEIRAVVIEDNPGWQEILSEILSDIGLVVDVADTLETALPVLRATPHRIAIVDLALGDSGDVNNQDGLQILKAIRKVDPACIAIMLTGYATVELAVSTLTEYGAFSCLRKANFNRIEFRDLINKALTRAPATAIESESEVLGSTGDGEDISSASSNPCVIVIEDDAGWRSILAELLREASYSVDLCSSYGDALGRMRREHYQVAIIDLGLSGEIRPVRWETGAAIGDGFDLLRTAREKHIPAIVVSGVTDIDEIKRAYEQEGIFAYLEKQAFNRRIFLKTVAEAAAQAQAEPRELDVLTDRELEVLQLLAEGLPNKDIAETLVISNNTVKRHLKSIYAKLDVHTRAAAAAKLLRPGSD